MLVVFSLFVCFVSEEKCHFKPKRRQEWEQTWLKQALQWTKAMLTVQLLWFVWDLISTYFVYFNIKVQLTLKHWHHSNLKSNPQTDITPLIIINYNEKASRGDFEIFMCFPYVGSLRGDWSLELTSVTEWISYMDMHSFLLKKIHWSMFNCFRTGEGRFQLDIWGHGFAESI